MRLKLKIGSSVVAFQAVTSCTLGRKDCDVTVADPFCSHQHALFYQDPQGQLRIRDMKSTNGTFVGGERIHDQALSAGDTVRVGNARIEIVEFEPTRVAATPSRKIASFEWDENLTHTVTRGCLPFEA